MRRAANVGEGTVRKRVVGDRCTSLRVETANPWYSYSGLAKRPHNTTARARSWRTKDGEVSGKEAIVATHVPVTVSALEQPSSRDLLPIRCLGNNGKMP